MDEGDIMSSGSCSIMKLCLTKTPHLQQEEVSSRGTAEVRRSSINCFVSRRSTAANVIDTSQRQSATFLMLFSVSNICLSTEMASFVAPEEEELIID